jgi:hypothetical protein
VSCRYASSSCACAASVCRWAASVARCASNASRFCCVPPPPSAHCLARVGGGPCPSQDSTATVASGTAMVIVCVLHMESVGHDRLPIRDQRRSTFHASVRQSACRPLPMGAPPAPPVAHSRPLPLVGGCWHGQRLPCLPLLHLAGQLELVLGLHKQLLNLPTVDLSGMYFFTLPTASAAHPEPYTCPIHRTAQWRQGPSRPAPRRAGSA